MLKKEYLVYKSNTLIEARYRLTIFEQRVVLMLAGRILPTHEDFKPYRFTIKELAKICNLPLRGRLYGQTSKLITKLLTRIVTLRRPGGGWLKTHWVGSAEYLPGEGAFVLTFHPALKPYLLELKERWTAYQLGNVIQLRSKYSVRMYEILKQHEDLGTHYVELSELREILGLKKNEHISTTKLQSRVLDVAKRELLKKTDIKFTYRKKTVDRKIVGFRFSISRNSGGARAAAAGGLVVEKCEQAESVVDRQEHLPFPPVDLIVGRPSIQAIDPDREPVPQTESILQARKIRQSLAEQLKTP